MTRQTNGITSEEEQYYLTNLDNKYPDAVWSRMNKDSMEKLN